MQNPSSVGWPTFPATERTGIHDFLRVHRARVMEAANREGGRNGEAWQDARGRAAADLIWTFNRRCMPRSASDSQHSWRR